MDTEGIARNIFNIIDASYYIGKDATILQKEDARTGEYAIVYGPNKEIMDTGWSVNNAWVGLHTLLLRWETNSSKADQVQVEYLWRDEEGNEGVHKRSAEFQDGISYRSGNGIGRAYFHENNEYRIIVRSSPSVEVDKYVAVDYIGMLVTNAWNVRSFIYPSVEKDIPLIPTIEAGICNAYSDGTDYYGMGTVNLIHEYRFYYPTLTPLIAGGYVARVNDIRDDSFDVVFWRTDGQQFNGGISIFYNIMGWSPPISLK